MRCGLYISPRWSSNDETMAEFYDRLEEAVPHDLAIPGLRLHAEMRELAGRRTFGHSFLARDNAREGTEEAADGANYALFEILASRRRGGEEEWALALTAAHHFAKAHEALEMMRAHRHVQFSDTPQDR